MSRRRGAPALACVEHDIAMRNAAGTLRTKLSCALALLVPVACASPPPAPSPDGESGAAGAGAVATSTSALSLPDFSGVVRLDYDSAGRLRKVVYADESERTYGLDPAGNRTRVSTRAPLSILQFAFTAVDLASRPVEERAAPTLSLQVQRSGNLAEAASVTCSTGDGTAVAGSDYRATAQTLSWAAGDGANKTCTVALIDNAELEPNETFRVALSVPGNARLGLNAALTITILDRRDPDSTPPTAPGNVRATALSSTSVKVTWAASSDPLVPAQLQSGLKHYQVLRDGAVIRTEPVPGALEYSDSGLAGGRTYRYRVIAFDQANNQAASAEAVIATPAAPQPDRTPPSVPTGVSAVYQQNVGVNVSWRGSTDPVVQGALTSGLDAYDILRNGVVIGTSQPEEIAWYDNGAQPGTRYLYSVIAFDRAGNRSAASAPFEFILPAPPPPLPPALVPPVWTGTFANCVYPSFCKFTTLPPALSWSAVPGATHYQLWLLSYSGESGTHSDFNMIHEGADLAYDARYHFDFIDQYYLVRACNGSECAEFSEYLAIEYDPYF